LFQLGHSAIFRAKRSSDLRLACAPLNLIPPGVKQLALNPKFFRQIGDIWAGFHPLDGLQLEFCRMTTPFLHLSHTSLHSMKCVSFRLSHFWGTLHYSCEFVCIRGLLFSATNTHEFTRITPDAFLSVCIRVYPWP